MKQKEKIINVDVVIDSYNKRNPDKRQMTKRSLAEMVGVQPQLFTDWKGGKKTPKWVNQILKLKEIGKCDIEDFIKDNPKYKKNDARRN